MVISWGVCASEEKNNMCVTGKVSVLIRCRYGRHVVMPSLARHYLSCLPCVRGDSQWYLFQQTNVSKSTVEFQKLVGLQNNWFEFGKRHMLIRFFFHQQSKRTTVCIHLWQRTACPFLFTKSLFRDNAKQAFERWHGYPCLIWRCAEVLFRSSEIKTHLESRHMLDQLIDHTQGDVK